MCVSIVNPLSVNKEVCYTLANRIDVRLYISAHNEYTRLTASLIRQCTQVLISHAALLLALLANMVLNKQFPVI